MYARPLAVLCLFFAAMSAGLAQSAVSADSGLVVYLRAGASQPAEPVRYMKLELESIMSRAGYRVEWRGPNQRVDAPSLAVVELSGTCAPGPAGVAAETASLASTSVTDGQVLPFSIVNCTALTKALGPARPSDYGRAMARVLAHELYHVLTQTTDHGRVGIAKPCFSTADLLATRFEFEETVLVRLRRLRPALAAPAALADLGEDASGR